MAKPFRSDKRRKEILRLKKQEEKRQRRFGAKQEPGEEGDNQDTQMEGAQEDTGAEETQEDTGAEKTPENELTEGQTRDL